jgi:hypothetical protein
LLHDAPPNILKHVVAQFSKVLPHDSKARRLFVTSGGLKKVILQFTNLFEAFFKSVEIFLLFSLDTRDKG